MDLNKDIINLLAGACIIIGALSCFYGYRIFKFILSLIGFLIFGAISGAIAYHFTQEILSTLILGLLGGLIGAAVMVPLYFVGVFLSGSFLGGIFGVLVYAITGLNPDPVALLVIAVIGGILAVYLEKFMIILSTSFSGALSLVFGIGYFTTSTINFINLNNIHNPEGTFVYTMILSWIAFGIFGVIVQYRQPNMITRPSAVSKDT